MRVMNINTGQANDHVKEERYWPVREAILTVLPRNDSGITWSELVLAVTPLLPRDLFPKSSTIRWYTKAVQLDLEARGLIERNPRIRGLRLRLPYARA